MKLLYIFSYFAIGYTSALIYYAKCYYIDGKPIEDKPRKAIVVFLLWPAILLLFPFTLCGSKSKE